MKHKVLKFSLISIITIIAILAISLGIYKFAEHGVSYTTADKTSKLAGGAGSLIKTSRGLRNTNLGERSAADAKWTDYGVPQFEGYNIFCVMKHGHVTEGNITEQEAIDVLGSASRLGTGDDGLMPTAGHVNDIHKGNKYKSYEKYCKEDTGSENVNGMGLEKGLWETPSKIVPTDGEVSLPPAMAYIISSTEGVNTKQWAIWGLKGSGYDNGLNVGEDCSGNSLTQESKEYAEYDKKVRNNGINPSDNTSINNVSVYVNQNNNTYTVGPFNINYTQGVSSNIAFAGMSAMYVIGYDESGNQVSKSKVNTFVLDGSTVTAQYFEPNGKYVDESNQVYPKPGQNFKVVFSARSNVKKISLLAEFQYMLANGKYTKINTHSYTLHTFHECKIEQYPGLWCNREEHEHRDSCYGWTCEKNEHQHRDDCYTISGHLECGIEEHTHSYSSCRGLTCGRSQHKHNDNECYACVIRFWSNKKTNGQQLISGDANRSLYQQELMIATNPKPDLRIDLDGYVWEDVPSGKEHLADGIKGSVDKPLKNIKVTLYERGGSTVGTTYTDGNGYYRFTNLYAQTKYYVTYEYNGQTYMPTDYLVSGGDWSKTSKANDTQSDRTVLRDRFREICSSPVNYPSTNSLNSEQLIIKDGLYYNETFSQYDLMGFVLDKDGNYYRDDNLALIDSFYKAEDGKIVEKNTLQHEGKTTKQSNYQEIVNKILSSSSGSKTTREELWRKLQYIEDCKIKAKTQNTNGTTVYYPPENEFTAGSQNTHYINLGLWRRQEVDLALSKDVAYAATKVNGKTEIYTYNIGNQMLDGERDELNRLRAIYERDRTNIANYQAYLNYKTQIENKYNWEIQLRMRQYVNYYQPTYTRELYPADYNYISEKTNKSGKDLELYITYKISIRNSSTNIMGEITEVVDYYDTDYTPVEELSWIMYSNSNNNQELSLDPKDYLNTIDKLSFQGNLSSTARPVKKPGEIWEQDASRYGGQSQKSGMEAQYNALYIRGLDGKKLASGEEAFIYLTFKVNPDGDKPVILDKENSLKQNYAEINGYKTYYKKGTILPNNVTIGKDNELAGLIDIDSNPGNLKLSDINVSGRYEQNFEDDTDRAKSIKVVLKDDYIRGINGVAWEDKRDKEVEGAMIGDGVMSSGEIGVKGVTVQLVEKLSNGKDFVWQETSTGSGKGTRINLNSGNSESYTYDSKGTGYYQFTDTLPGEYIVRFKYGDTYKTVLTTKDNTEIDGEKGQNITSYNGQDFKSTIYQRNFTKEEAYDLPICKDEEGIDKPGYYNIQGADNYSNRISDAKDVWGNNVTTGTRQYVNYYSNNNGTGVTNKLAEILTSPYAQNIDNSQVKDLKNNTYMVAETEIIELKGEYNRTISAGQDDKNGKYTLNNLDFGLVERPKAQLELSKKITNIKITLSDGKILFDTAKSTDGLMWQPTKAYELANKMEPCQKGAKKYIDYYDENGSTNNRYAYRTEVNKLVSGKFDATTGNNGFISISTDNEFTHGATIKISYDLTVTNVGEVDYTGENFYYKGTGASDATKETTTPNVVLDYVANNLQFRAEDNKKVNGNSIWKTVSGDVTSVEGLNGNIAESVKKHNTVIETTALSKALKPGENNKVGLVLTQVITPENTADDKTYNNIAEITKISNNLGRRMAYSVQGNQDPTQNPAEVDSSKSEEVIVGKATGIGNIMVYVALTIGVLVILIGGIILIKKKVLNK